ncbi:MAG TPA: hypothetical protein VFF73_20065, partial [Planctomycetota bacterium]|nr:hypothetical protein [Planctomycetota bacterium]
GLDATILRAGEIVIDALIRGTPFPALDAAHALGAVLLEHVRRHDTAALMELLATIRGLAADGAPQAARDDGPRGAESSQPPRGNAAAREAAQATLSMLVPGAFLEPVLYEILRTSTIPTGEFEDLLQRIARHAPEALARLWLAVEAPDRQARVRQRLFEAATENVACLEPLTSGEFGADAARLAVDLLVEAKGPEKADVALKKLVDDPGVAEAARVRALVRLEGDREIKALLAKLRNPTRPTREGALLELEKNGAGIDAAREGIEAFMQERAFWSFDQDEMDAVTRAFANIADLRSVRVLDNLAEGSRKITLRLFSGGGSVPEAAKKALLYLKEKRRVPRPTIPQEIRDAFDDYARRLLRRVVKRPIALSSSQPAPFVHSDTDLAEVGFSGASGTGNELHARAFDGLARSFRLVRTFDTSNAVFDEPIAALSESIHKLIDTDREVELRIDEGTVFVNRSPLRLDRAAHARALELQADLAACGMGGILFKQAVTPADARGLVGAVATALAAKAPQAVFSELGAGLVRARLEHSVRPLSLGYIAETSLVAKAEASGGVLARRTYGRALGILTLLYDRYEEQELRHFLVRRLRRAVQNLSSLLEKEPDRALALHVLKASGDALIDHALGSTIVALALGRAQGFSRSRLADVGVAAALHAIAHRTRTGDRTVHADMMRGIDDETLRRAPYKTVAELLMERSLEPLFATTLVAGYEHTIPDGYPDANEDLPPLLASRTVAVAHRYHLYSLRRAPRQALDIVLESATHDPRVTLHLAKVLGPAPVGSVVVLQDGRVAVVARPGDKLPNRPRVRVLENGVSQVLDLTDGPGIGRVIDQPASANDLAPFLFS